MDLFGPYLIFLDLYWSFWIIFGSFLFHIYINFASHFKSFLAWKVKWDHFWVFLNIVQQNRNKSNRKSIKLDSGPWITNVLFSRLIFTLIYTAVAWQSHLLKMPKMHHASHQLLRDFWLFSSPFTNGTVITMFENYSKKSHY